MKCKGPGRAGRKMGSPADGAAKTAHPENMVQDRHGAQYRAPARRGGYVSTKGGFAGEIRLSEEF